MPFLAGQRLTAAALNALENTIPSRLSGTVSVSVAAGGYQSVHVTFSTAFPAPPHIDATSGNGRLNVSISNVTAEGFDVNANNWTSGGTGTTNIYWHAVEKL